MVVYASTPLPISDVLRFPVPCTGPAHRSADSWAEDVSQPQVAALAGNLERYQFVMASRYAEAEPGVVALSIPSPLIRRTHS